VNATSLVLRNNCASNGRLNTFAVGISTGGGAANRIEGNNVVGGPFGIGAGLGDIVFGNTSRANYKSNYSFFAGCQYGPVLNATNPATPAVSGTGPFNGTLVTVDPWANFSF